MIGVNTDFLDIFQSEEKLLLNEPMRNHTSFKIGGNADYILLPQTQEDISTAIRLCRENNYPFYVMGNGSNLLVSDEGYKGLIIKICKNFSGCLFDKENCVITAKSGTLLSELSTFALKHGLTGLEFASGIPGTIGGGIYMNAGAYDGEIKNVCINASLLTETGNIVSMNNQELGFDYRYSKVQEGNGVVLSAGFKLKISDKTAIKEKTDGFSKQRKEKQPLSMPSAGSAFKRPKGHFAGKLIMDCGLRGFSIGDAAVSDKHCGFIVNKGNATAADVQALTEHIIKCVYNNFGVVLEPEFRRIGNF